MNKILLPVDGSASSAQAVAVFIKLLGDYREMPQIDLINVQHSLRGDISLFINQENIRQYHEDEGLKALQPARDLLDKAGIAYTYHVSVGDPVEAIISHCKQQGCSQIVIARHGLGAVAGVLLGSIAHKVIQLAAVPVLVL